MIPTPITEFIKKHRTWLVPLLILVVAFSARLAYLNQIQEMPTFNYPVMDEKYHVKLAEQINSDEGLPAEPFYRAPLYPYVFAFLHKISGESMYVPRFVQILFGMFVPLLVYFFGLRLFTPRVACWAGGVAALYPTLIYYDASLLITSLMVLLTMLLLFQLYRCQTRPCLFNFVLAGILIGLAGLARPNILLLGPVLILWIWLVIKPQIGWKKALIRYGVMGLFAFLIILPVTIRNYVVADDPVFIAWQGGFNFFLGNNRAASGWSATVPGIDMTWEGGYEEAIAIAEQAEQHKLKRSEVSDFWYDRAFEEINQDRAGFVALMFRKLRLFFNGFEIGNNQDLYFNRNYSPLLARLMFTGGLMFPYGLIAPLALLGVAFSIRKWRDYLLVYLVIGSYVMSLLLFFVCARFRQPVMPLLILLAVFGAIHLFELFRSRQKKNLILALFIFALLLVETNHDMLGLDPKHSDATSHANMGLAFLEENRLSRAYAEFKKSADLDPNYGSAFANLGTVTSRQGKLAEATAHLTRALSLEPNVPDRYTNLANNYFDRSDTASAIAVMEDGARQFPNNPAVMLRLALAYLDAGRLDQSRAIVVDVLRTYPENETARAIYTQIENLAK